MNARLKDPALRPEDAVSWLDVEMRDGGELSFPNWAIYFEPLWEEVYDGMEANEPRIEIVPSFVLQRKVNGKTIRTAYGSLMAALREVEK